MLDIDRNLPPPCNVSYACFNSKVPIGLDIFELCWLNTTI